MCGDIVVRAGGKGGDGFDGISKLQSLRLKLVMNTASHRIPKEKETFKHQHQHLQPQLRLAKTRSQGPSMTNADFHRTYRFRISSIRPAND